MSAEQSRAIWIVGYNDDGYPTRFKDRLKDHSPPIIYGEKYRFVPVYVRTTGDAGRGLEALQRKGALPWTNPTGSDDFEELLDHAAQVKQTSSSEQLSFL